MLKQKFVYISYLFSCILHMNYSNLFRTIKTVNKMCGKSRLFLFFDIVYCGLKYGAAFQDYVLFEFFKLNNKQRSTYVTRVVNNTISNILNDRNEYHIFDNKDEFYTLFSDFIGREWVYIAGASREDFESFMENKEEIIAKPSNGGCGVGVEKLKKSDFSDLDEMYEYLSKKPRAIAEEVIKQHEDLNRLNPGSVNTLRIVTVISDGKVHVIYGYIRIGNSLRPVDNLNAGGMCAPIDLDSGIVSHVGYDKSGVIYHTHPNTGCVIKGFKIPMWNESLELCKRAANVVPRMGYIGWDVAVTPAGPILVEGNTLPGHDILQLPPHVPDRVGMLPRFKMFVKGL